MPDGRASACPECLTKDGVFRLVSDGAPCERCGKPVAERLTPRELRNCIKAAPAIRTTYGSY